MSFVIAMTHINILLINSNIERNHLIKIKVNFTENNKNIPIFFQLILNNNIL